MRASTAHGLQCASALRPTRARVSPVRKTELRFIKRLNRPALLLALGLAAASPAAAIFVTSTPEADARARDRLLRAEAEIAVRLRETGGDPRLGVELAEILGSERNVLLQHPSAAIVQAIAAARDPAALALAIAHDQLATYGSYATDALLAALAVEPGRTQLWLEAAHVSFAPAYRAVFLGRALESLPKDLLTATSPELPRAAIAAERLGVLLHAGLVREALADFDRLPAALRERIAAGEVRAAEIDGTVVGPPEGDICLELALARLIVGDVPGARALVARSPGPVWSADDEPLADMGGEIGPLQERTLAKRWLDPPAKDDDPFPFFARVATASSFWRWGVGLIAAARLAEREGYPAVADFAWRHAAEDLMVDASSLNDPDLAPPDLGRAAAILRQAIAAQERAARAAAAAATTAAGGPPSIRLMRWKRSAWPGCSAFGFSAASFDQLFVLDRTGRRGLVLSSTGDESGGLQFEEHDGRWTAKGAYGNDLWEDIGRDCVPKRARHWGVP